MYLVSECVTNDRLLTVTLSTIPIFQTQSSIKIGGHGPVVGQGPTLSPGHPVPLVSPGNREMGRIDTAQPCTPQWLGAPSQGVSP